MFLIVQERKGLTLNLARNLINGQVVGSDNESESSERSIKKEKRLQKEQEKIEEQKK